MPMAKILPLHALFCRANPSIPTETLTLLLKMFFMLQISSELCVYPLGSLATAWMCLCRALPSADASRAASAAPGCQTFPGPRWRGSFLHPSLLAGSSITRRVALPCAFPSSSPGTEALLMSKRPRAPLPAQLSLREAPGGNKPAWSQTAGADTAVPLSPCSTSPFVPPARRVSSAEQSA